MEKEYVAAVIGVAGTVVGTVLGFFLTFLYELLKDRRRIKEEFYEIKGVILYGVTTNEIPRNLNALRRFYVKNSHKLKNELFHQFYEKWLHDPLIERGQPALSFDKEKTEAMFSDLEQIKL